MSYSSSDHKEIEEALSWLNRYWNKPLQPVYYDAKTLEEAVSLLGAYHGEAKIIAGGTDLLGLMKNEVLLPAVLVNIKNIPSMEGIKENSEGLEIGALARINEIERSAILKETYPLLHEAAHSIGSPQIRNMATLGGNLCQQVRCWYYRRSPRTGISFICRRKKESSPCYAINGENEYHAIFGESGCVAVSPSDMATGLFALDARINTISSKGERAIPIRNFYTPFGQTLDPDEIITSVSVAKTQPHTKQRFIKFRPRKAIDFSTVSVSAVITSANDVIQDARIVVGGVSPLPYEAAAAERVLIGESMKERVAEEAAEAAVRDAMPLSKNGFKVPLVKALIKRSILE
ncbi:MAG TPA: xanthine dehydrogenase family protein subunit M [Thermodesulfobacteriota bacterium]|nr:xanthine dehydrogenase family protein subunit M [Thermodesulfobacteriota bacterium]